MRKVQRKMFIFGLEIYVDMHFVRHIGKICKYKTVFNF